MLCDLNRSTFVVQCNVFQYNVCLNFQLSGFLIIMCNVTMLPFTNKHKKWAFATEDL